IVSGSADETIRIWDAHTGQPVGTPLEGHTSSVESVTYSLDGQHIVSGSLDKTIHIWNASKGHSINLQSNQPSSRLQNDGWIVDLASSPPALLMWLPPQYQTKGLYTPFTCCVIGAQPIHLDLSDFGHGPRWAECMKQ
ncbi:hypothetical protein FA95DRAFT_1497600, partial [Auriscalpium vulgare]